MEHEDLIRENLMLKDQLGQLGKTLENVLASGRAVDEHIARDRAMWQIERAQLLETIVGLRVRGSLLKQRTRRLTETMKTCKRVIDTQLADGWNDPVEMRRLLGRIDEVMGAHQ
jgi:hypothetical protein